MKNSLKQHIPLNTAFLCCDCSAIGNCSTICPACASLNIFPLAGVLDRKEERQEAA